MFMMNGHKTTPAFYAYRPSLALYAAGARMRRSGNADALQPQHRGRDTKINQNTRGISNSCNQGGTGSSRV